MLETLEQVKSTEAVPPSRLQPGLPRDLETITLKCLEKDPQRRYATALELADDLRRYLDGEPIRAQPVGPLERGLKWVRRRPLEAGFLARHRPGGPVADLGLHGLDLRARTSPGRTASSTPPWPTPSSSALAPSGASTRPATSSTTSSR